MKKALLSTTALVAAGFAVESAAAEPLRVSIGGFFVGGFYVIDADNYTIPAMPPIPSRVTDFASTDVKIGESEFELKAEGTLDSGVVAGVLVELEAPPEGTKVVDEAYVYLDGGFGRLIVGSTDGAGYLTHYTSPWFVPGNGVDSPNFINSSRSPTSRTNTQLILTDDANKIVYFTPRFSGVQLGLSYTPDNQNLNGAKNSFALREKNTGAVNDVFALGLNYVDTWEEFNVALAIGWEGGSRPDAEDDIDPQNWHLGGEFAYAGVTLGGGYYEAKDFADLYGKDIEAGLEQTAWTGGVSYGDGPWTVGVAHFASKNAGGEDAAKTGAYNFTQVGGGYNVGAGVDIGLDVQFIEDTNDAAATKTVKSTSAGLLLSVSF